MKRLKKRTVSGRFGDTEALESRVLLAGATTDLSLVSGNLVVTDTAAGGQIDTLTIKSDTANSKFIISDPFQLLKVTSIPGAVVSADLHSVEVPFSAVTGTDLRFSTLAGNDSLTVDLSLGNFSKSIVYDGGLPTSGDSLFLAGGGIFSQVDYQFLTATNGTIDLSGSNQLSFTGVEFLNDNLSATDRTFSYSAGSQTINVTDGSAGDGKTTIDSNQGKPVSFKNPTGNITINGSTGDDNIVITSVDSAFNAGLTLNGLTGFDTVDFNTDVTFASGRGLTVAAEQFNTGAGVDIVTSGSGDITITSEDVALNATSTLRSADTVTFVTQTPGRSINLGGTAINSLNLVETELDAITTNRLLIGNSVSGQILVFSDISPAHTTTLHLTSRFLISGGSTAGIIVGNLALTAGSVDFRSPNTDVNNVAIFTATGDLDFFDATALTVTSVDGVNGITSAISLDLGAGGSLTVLDTPAAVDIGCVNTLNITVAGSNSLFSNASGSRIEASSSFVHVVADRMDFSGTLVGSFGQFETFTAGRPISLGSNPGSSTALELSVAELTLLPSTVRIGRNDASASGDISITAPIRVTNLILRTGGGVIDANPSGSDITCNNLTLRTGTGVGSSGPDLNLETSVSTLSFLNTASGDIRIAPQGGTTVGSTDGFVESSNAGGSVIISARNGISVNHPIRVTGSGALRMDVSNGDILLNRSLTTVSGDIQLSASNSISAIINGVVVTTTSGNVIFDADSDSNGMGGVLSAAEYSLGTGTATFHVARSGVFLPELGGVRNINGYLANVISGPGNIVKTGPDRLALIAANVYTGTTAVNEGDLVIIGSIASNTTVASGARLTGNGTIESGHTLTVQSGGTLVVGDSTAIFHVGSTTLNPGSTLGVNLNGASVGTKYDQLDVTGTVQLSGAQLMGSLGYLPHVGDSFKIINNDGTDPVVGTFNGLPQGVTFGSDAARFVIDYQGGDGNDVVLTVVAASSSTLVVTTTSDVVNMFDDVTSLREAITFANSDPDSTTITFDPSLFAATPATLVLTDGVLDVTSSLVIAGPGANLLTLDGNNRSQILRVSDTQGVGFALSLSDLTIAHGFISDGDGGAIESTAILNLTNCTFRDNRGNEGGALSVSSGETNIYYCTFIGNSTLDTGGGDGGAISNWATLTVVNSLFTSNFALDEGGVIDNNGTAVFINSTLSGNTSNNTGGAINNQGQLVLVSSTVTLNRADADGDGAEGLAGGGIRTDDDRGVATLYNSLIAGNVRGAIGADIPADLSVADPLFIGVAAASVNNLIGDPSSAAELVHGTNGNTLGQNNGDGGRAILPVSQILNLLLSDNGGPTLTHALVPNGPAVNAGSDTVSLGAGIDPFLTTDQRGTGFLRKVSTIDIGAFEVQVLTPPIADIVDVTPDPRNMNAGIVNIQFGESVSGVDISDFTLTRNGTPVSLSSLKLNGAGANYSIDLSSVTALEGDYVFTLNAQGSGIQNAVHTVLTQDATDRWFLDLTAPSVDITPNAITTNTASATFTFQFGEPVTGFHSDDVSVTNGTKGTFTQVDDDTYTLIVTPLADGPVSVSVNSNVATDFASNGNLSGGATIISDRTAPILNISPIGTITNSSSITFTFQFSEDVAGFDVSDIAVTNGTKGPFATLDGHTYTLVVTPVDEGIVSVGVDAAVATDSASNNSLPASASVSSDRIAPFLSISPSAVLTNVPSTTFTFQFSEIVTGFDVSDVQVTNGTKGTFTAIDGDTYTLVVTPIDDGAVIVGVNANKASDLATNGNVAASATITSDRIAPFLNISPNGIVTNAGSTLLTFQFSETVTGFDASDISVTNSTKGTFTAIDGDTYTLVVAPVDEGAVTVNVSSNIAVDSATNGNSAATATITSDRTAPSLTITPNGLQTNAASTTFTFQFSEAVTGFDDGDVTVTNGTKGIFTAVDSRTYTLVVAPLGDGAVSVSVNNNVAIDAASNGNSAATATIASDRTAPFLTITPNGLLTNAASLTLTLQFSETVTGFDATDATIVNGTKGAFTEVDGKTYTLIVTPISDGAITITVASGAATDIAANRNIAASATISSDRTAPVLNISPNGTLTPASSTTFTFQFSESVTGFDASDVTVVNGTKGGFTALDGDTYTLVIMPITDGDVTVSVNAGAASDGAGNANLAASATITSDQTHPSLQIMPDATLSSAPSLTFTFHFSEAVTGFDQNDVQLVNGSAGAFTAVNEKTFTLVVTPDADGPVIASVNGNTATDLATNGNLAASVTATSDRQGPVFTSAASTQIEENSTHALTANATDAHGPVVYAILNDSDAAHFTIDPQSGDLQFIIPPDFESPADQDLNNVYQLQIAATDALGQTAVQNVTVTVAGVNDNPPAFTSSANYTVDENQTGVGTVSAVDADRPQQGITFSITGGEDATKFAISADGTLTLVAPLDFESPTDSDSDNLYNVTITATDSINPQFSTSQNLIVRVVNVNEAPSNLVLSATTVNEQLPVGTLVGTLTTTDPDAADTFTYSLVSGTGSVDNPSFRIVGNQLQTNTVLNFIARSSYSVRLRSTDAEGLSIEKTSTITVAQVITDLLRLNGGDVTWVKRTPPVTVLPQSTVANGLSFASGTLTIRIATVGSKKKSLDLLQIPSTGFGTAVQDSRTPLLTNVSIQLRADNSASELQAFLRGITFATKGKGLKLPTRTMTVTLTDGIGHSTSITQTIHVLKKAQV